MQLLTVSPLAKGIPYEELTYFSKLEVSAGDLVEITIKKRVCRALVLRVQNVHDEKQSLKNASFITKKISKVVSSSFLDKKVWQALEYVSSYLIRSVGSLIYDLISEKSFDVLTAIVSPEERGFEILLLEQSHKNRLLRYKTTIREMFSKKKSLVIFFPTVVDLEYAKEDLGKGIAEHVVILHGGLTEKQFNDGMEKLTKEEHPLLILCTPSLLPWSRKDLGLVVIEREHSHYYYTHGNASYDMRMVLETLARYTKIPCLLGSHMLSLRAHRLYDIKDAVEVLFSSIIGTTERLVSLRNKSGITSTASLMS
jgi:primosomal protein N'